MSAPKQKTAIEWLQAGLELIMTHEQQMQAIGLIEQAKEMEREQIMDAWKHGNLPTFLGRQLTADQYYKETYD